MAQATITEWRPIKGPIYRADDIRGVMQFSLAADRILGSFFDPEGLEEEGLGPRPNTQRGGRDDMRGGFGT